MRYRVEFSPEASSHAATIQDWWVANRPKARDLFLSELHAAVMQVRRSPWSGRVYAAPEVPPTRMLLLPKTRYHLFYRLDEDAGLVRIVAVWHSARGEGPPLP